MFTIPGVEHANDLLHEANVILLKTWIEQIVFTWRWWLEVSISIISWVYFWFFLRKKPDTYRLICAGFFSMVVSTYLDTVGMAMLSLIHISEPTRLGMISYAVFCLKKKKK